MSRSQIVWSAVAFVLIGALAGSSPAWRASGFRLPASAALSASEKVRLERITTIFENGDPTFQYAYIENLNDGRGYTAGRVGFCTGTGDLIQVVQLYTKEKPANALAKYLPTLQKLTEEGSGDVSGLPDFIPAWQTAAKDSVFRDAQDQIVDQLYYNPAMGFADEVAITLPMGKSIIYDTAIMHGYNVGDPDSLVSIIDRTKQKYCSLVPTAAPSCLASNENEQISWLHVFLAIRKEDLLNPYDKASQEEWSQNAVRADDLESLLEQYKGQIPPASAEIHNYYYDGKLGP